MRGEGGERGVRCGRGWSCHVPSFICCRQHPSSPFSSSSLSSLSSPPPPPLSDPLQTITFSRQWPGMVEGAGSILTPKPNQSGNARCVHSCPRPSSQPSHQSPCSGSSLTRMHRNQSKWVCAHTHTHTHHTHLHTSTPPLLPSSPGPRRAGSSL